MNRYVLEKKNANSTKWRQLTITFNRLEIAVETTKKKRVKKRGNWHNVDEYRIFDKVKMVYIYPDRQQN